MKESPSLNSTRLGHRRSVAEWLAQVRLGAPQTYREIAVWPLFLDGEDDTPYRTLDEAVDQKQARVTEVSQSGSVPELKVLNDSPNLILILDGEELIGAKQNRVVNTTLLLKPKSHTIIPVSCTEQGRWRHVSKAFSSSHVVMEMKARLSKLRSVSDSLS